MEKYRYRIAFGKNPEEMNGDVWPDDFQDTERFRKKYVDAAMSIIPAHKYLTKKSL